MSPRRAALWPSPQGRPEHTLALTLAACLSFGCGPAAPAAPAVARPAPVDAARLTEIYSSFSYGNCQSGSDCPAVFAKAVGADLGPSGKRPGPNPRATMKNPDPEWLPEWERLPESEARAHYTYEALALAAVQRSWSRACDEAYRAYDKAMDERMTALDRAIAEKNRDPNPYDRLGALLALEPEEPKKEGMGEFVKGSDAVRYRWEAAVFEAFEDTARTFVYSFDAYAPSEALVSTMRPRQAEAYERDAFCLDAAAGKIPGVKPLPDTSAWDTDVRGMVKLAVPTSRAQAVEQRRKELTTQVRLKFQKAMLPDPKLPPGVRELEIANISRFERDGRAAVITSTATREERAGGKTVKIDETVRTTFADWPSGVVLGPGDSVAFYGTESRVKDTTIRSTPELEHLSRETALEAKHITRLTAKGQTKKYFR